MKKNNLIIAVSVFSTALLFACAEAPKKEEVTEEVVLEEVEEIEDESADLMLPSPIQIASIFNRSGLTYNGELPNSPDAVSNYNTKTKKYLNFGVYSADMAYSVLNKKQQESIDYLAAIKKLSDETGMDAIFSTGNMVERFEKNIGTQDSIMRILTEIKIKTDSYLEENKEQAKMAIFFTGAWVEGMYLGTKSASGNEMVKDRVLEQMNILKNLIPALRAQSDETFDLTEVANQLEAINTFYQSVATEDAEGYATINPDDMIELTKKIEALRSNIVSA
ncbi:hypothetical protein [Acidiluteibacter ferrifornacis]|uniref:Lipoprotein n=1 Tax=Acidiluteibacter ferrifornacis TaxID=2692424 RepID=A0A6N9NN46_9FLAO|nr:hypothetical protein [Acidiluteibacter ferrifornacis]NBG67312.1 hypothetical protein [Acidiluteibacter ferrifornacis]